MRQVRVGTFTVGLRHQAQRHVPYDENLHRFLFFFITLYKTSNTHLDWGYRGNDRGFHACVSCLVKHKQRQKSWIHFDPVSVYLRLFRQENVESHSPIFTTLWLHRKRMRLRAFPTGHTLKMCNAIRSTKYKK